MSNDEKTSGGDTRGLTPGFGLLVLEMQQGVLQFLVGCCKQIMHDVSSEKLLNDDYHIHPAAGLPDTTVKDYASLAVMTAEAPYRPPGNLDLKRLDSLFAARAEYFADHIWVRIQIDESSRSISAVCSYRMIPGHIH